MTFSKESATQIGTGMGAELEGPEPGAKGRLDIGRRTELLL
jgi:hypothetical protein